VTDSPEDRRTRLAVERTYLAWWRTGLTAYAVALATARLVPDIAKSKHHWPYTVIGIGFALLGSGCVLYGERRRRGGEFEDVSPLLSLCLTVGGILLGLGLLVVVAIEP
jgi:putative membrane protein